MLAILTAASFFLLIGGGVVMPYDTNIAIGLYMSSPIPLIARKVIQYYRTEPQEPKQTPSSEDPVAPTPDEPSAV
jgi:hypothetical protein